jgi:peroxiredoxin
MKKLLCLFAIVFFCTGFSAFTQQPSRSDSAIHQLTEEKDPGKAVLMVNDIIEKYVLDKNKDAETLDVLYGTVAVNFAMHHNYPQFEKYIASVHNLFNQTSFMNLAASKMLDDDINPAYANLIARKTLTLYQSIKNDSTARPKEFSKKDWERFMDFAQYPYNDTYAQSLFALNKYEEALKYQKMAFQGKPEEGLPASVQRYAKLLQLTGKKKEAKDLLLKMASLGKLNKGMTEQLQSIYISENGTDENLGRYLDSLQRNVQATLVRELKPKMLNKIAPGFVLKDINGNVVTLSDYAGKTVVLDLWATWCRPCIASFPAMQLMVKKHPEVAFLFIAVEEKDPDPLPAVKNFIEKKNYSFTVLLDEPVKPGSSQYKITSAYKPDGIPAKYIIDKNGMLRFKTSGFDTDTELVNELEAMFAILNSL